MAVPTDGRATRGATEVFTTRVQACGMAIRATIEARPVHHARTAFGTGAARPVAEMPGTRLRPVTEPVTGTEFPGRAVVPTGAAGTTAKFTIGRTELPAIEAARSAWSTRKLTRTAFFPTRAGTEAFMPSR